LQCFIVLLQVDGSPYFYALMRSDGNSNAGAFVFVVNCFKKSI